MAGVAGFFGVLFCRPVGLVLGSHLSSSGLHRWLLTFATLGLGHGSQAERGGFEDGPLDVVHECDSGTAPPQYLKRP